MSPELGTLQSRGRIYGCNASLVNSNMALAIWGRTIYVPGISVHPTAAEEFVTMREPAR